MHLERLVIDSGERTFAADFHPKLTVIGGLDRAERTALTGEVIDALAGGKPGVHLEVVAGGRSLAVFRPPTGRHRVIDTDSVSDVTAAHLGSDGEIDLFAAVGVDRTLAKRAIRLSREDLVLRGATDEYVNRLAEVDQDELWEAAIQLKSATEVLENVSAESGATVTDVELMDEVEQRHGALVEATASYDRIRLICLTIADIGAIVGLALAFSDNTASGIPFLLMAIAGVVLALRYRRNVRDAEQAERDVLAGTGASDYASFQVERVNSLLANDAERRRFMDAVSRHRDASREWRRLAGDVSLVFALDHVDEIKVSANVHQGVRSLQNLSGTAPDVPTDVTSELAQALLTRIEAVRALTSGDDTLPLIVDDAFENLEPTVKPMMLEMLSASAGSPQVIVLTADDDVTSWARVEAMTGELSVVEPHFEPSVAGAT